MIRNKKNKKMEEVRQPIVDGGFIYQRFHQKMSLQIILKTGQKYISI